MFRLYVFFISFVLTFAPAYVYANAASGFGGWSIGQVASSAGQATINATKNIGGQVVKSYAQVAPTAGALAKNIARVGGVMAVSVAIDALLGGVDWVLDPANNRVKYFEPDQGAYLYKISGSSTTYLTAQKACQAFATQSLAGYGGNPQIMAVNVDGLICRVHIVGRFDDKWLTANLQTLANPLPPQEKYLSYDAVGAEIARRAAAGDPAANDFVADTANPNNWDEQSYPLTKPPIVQQLDANAGADAPPKPDDPPTTPSDPSDPFTLPAFCSWASWLCNAMTTSNSNSNRAATASEQNVQKTQEVANATNEAKQATIAAKDATIANGQKIEANTTAMTTAATAIQGELVNGNNKTDELKGAVVNAGSAANAAATAQKDATKATTDAVTDLKGEVVNAGSAANAAATAQKDATKATTDAVTDLKGEVVNQGTKIGDIATGIKDLISTSIDRIVDAITAAKDAVKDAVDAGTAENTRIGDQAHDDSVAEKEATEDQTAKDELHREWQKEQPTDLPPLPVSIDEPNLPVEQFDKEYVRYNAQCPQDISQSIEYGESTIELNFGYAPICDIAVKAKPFVIGAAGFAAFLIVAGVRRE